jgi:VWFA-related protein
MVFSPAAVVCQQPKPSPQPAVQSKDEVVRVTTNLVQVDVVATDKDGKQVSDLRPEDFEVFEDGRKQRITNFSYISADAGPNAQSAGTPGRSVEKDSPRVQPALLRPEDVRRTIALVIDDLGISFESVGFVRQAIRKFLDEQMQPNDLVAIILTSSGSGSQQQFTSDKRKLYAALDRIRWYPNGRGGESPFPVRNTSETAADFQNTEQVINEFEEEREATYAIGTFGTLGFIVRSLADMPGRKSLVLISEAFQLFTTQGRNERLLAAMRRLTDQANRASTVIYTLDASGLQTLNLTASDKVAGPGYIFNHTSAVLPATPPRETIRVDQSIAMQARRDSQDAFGKLNSLADQRRTENIEAQTVLSFLAHETGGIAARNGNDLGAGLQRIMDDQKGYYLLGYRLAESTPDPKTGQRRFHHLEVKVKRPGLIVRARNGFYGVTDEERRAKQMTPDEQLAAALTSPFASDGVRLRLTSLFRDEPDGRSLMRSLLQINAQDLTFAKEPDGSSKAVIDVVAVNFGDNGRAVDQYAQTQALTIDAGAYQRVLQDGLICVFDVPIKQAGAYQLRVAVRDTATGRVGAAGQFVRAPDLGKNRLTLSGVIVNGTIPAAKNSSPGSAGTNTATSNDAGTLAGPAVRHLRQGMILNYGYTIYNAQLDAATNRPQLQTQMRLMRDGKQVFAGRVLPFDVRQQNEMKRLEAGGRILIGPDLVPGTYVLEVIVTDLLAKGTFRTTTQWIDLEIVN